MYGPLCWQGCEREHGGLKKLMRYGIMKEFNCKVTSKWSNCGREKEMAFTHQQFVEKGKERKAQLDYIVGPRWKSDEACINNDVKIWDSWEHYPICAVIQQYEASNDFSARRRKKKWTGWRPKDDEANIESQRAVMRREDEKQEENLGENTEGY